jgi:hypothetical protein
MAAQECSPCKAFWTALARADLPALPGLARTAIAARRNGGTAGGETAASGWKQQLDRSARQKEGGR